MKVCIVDDDHTSRVLLGEYLEDRGWEIIVFIHPDKPSLKNTLLIDELSDKNTKLLIMDVRFGRDADGLEKGLTTVKKLAEEDKLFSDCCVLFVSQFGREKVQIDSVERSLKEKKIRFYWLDKPIDYVLLNERIQEISMLER